jgi:hypothetical protein
MMETMLAACARDTAWLENQLQQQHARQQQQQQQQPKGKKQAASKQRQASTKPAASQLDAAACARMLAYLIVLPPTAMCCRSKSLLTGTFAEHMKLCVRLCWALLQWDTTISSSSSTGGSHSRNLYGQASRNAEEHARWSLVRAAHIGLGFSGDVAVEVAYRRQENLGYPQLADQLADTAVFGLLLVNFALCVARLHARVSADSSRQVQLPEEHHRVLLQQLGVEWLEHVPFALQVGQHRVQQPGSFLLAASEALSQYMNRAAVGASSSSSSSSAVAEAAMLTLLQAALLPTPDKEVPWRADMSGVLANFVVQLSGSAAEAAAAVVLQPFLLQLLPAGVSAIKSATLAAPSISDSATPSSVSETEHASGDTAAATREPELLAQWFGVSSAGSLQVMLSTGGQRQRF